MGGSLLPRSAKAAIYLLTVLAILLAIFPLLWMVDEALKTNGEVISASSSLIPAEPQWHNLVDAWNAAPFGRYFLNTFIFSVTTTVGQIGIGLLGGYAVAMFDFPFKRILFYLTISGLMIPFTVVLVPVVQLISDFHWINTYQGLIVPNLASALGTVLFRQFFLGMPAELGNAARVDGASEWKIFFRVYRPLAQPMVASFAIIAFLQNWSNFLFPLVVTNSQNMFMISQGLSVFSSSVAKSTQYNLLMAGSLLAVIPILIVALIAQRKIVDGLTLGAVR